MKKRKNSLPFKERIFNGTERLYSPWNGIRRKTYGECPLKTLPKLRRVNCRSVVVLCLRRISTLRKYFLFMWRNVFWEQKKIYHTVPYRSKLSGVDIGLYTPSLILYYYYLTSSLLLNLFICFCGPLQGLEKWISSISFYYYYYLNI